jgi:hypothetical protein
MNAPRRPAAPAPNVLPGRFDVAVGNNRTNSSGQAPTIGQQRGSALINIAIAAGQTIPIPQAGNQFYFVVAQAPVVVQPFIQGATPGAAVTYSQGTGMRSAPGSEFSNLNVTNPNANSTVISLFVGFDGFIDNRLIEVSSGVSQVAHPVLSVPASTTTVNIPDLSGGAFTDIDGNSWLAISRVSIQMTNFASATDYLLQAYGAATNSGPAILGCLARTSLILNVDGNYAVSNGGGLINMVVSEIYNAISPTGI